MEQSSAAVNTATWKVKKRLVAVQAYFYKYMVSILW